MKQTTADLLVELLATQWDVQVVFGIPGEGISGLMEALRNHSKKIQLIQTRHEESAALMACNYAKLTGKLGVCIASSGPGGIHLLNGLYDAKLDGAPVLAITGMPEHDRIDTYYQQDVGLDRLFQDVSVYNARLMGPSHLESVLQLACRTALSRRGVAHISIPSDFQDLPARPERAGRRPETELLRLRAAIETRSSNEALQSASDLLNSGKRVAILAGQGAEGATQELIELAELLGAPIVKTLLGKGCLPDDSPLSLGCLGLIGTLPAKHAMERCDTLLMIGTSFPYPEFLPQFPRARGVQIDRNPERIGLRYPVEVGIIGDSATVLRQLIPLSKQKQNRDFIKTLQDEMLVWWKQMESLGRRVSHPLKPQVPFWELGKQLTSQAILTCDSGTSVTWLARQIPARIGQTYCVSGALGTMGSALPYAIAAQIAHPKRQVVALVGDGSLAMSLAELSTCVKYQFPIKILVLKNNRFGLTHWEQKVISGHSAFGCELEPIDFVKAAEAFGLNAYAIKAPESCGEILEKGLAQPGPVLFECWVDPDELPTPGP